MGMIVYPDWYVESIDMWIRTFFLIGMYVDPTLRGITRQRYVIPPAVFLTVTWSHLQSS